MTTATDLPELLCGNCEDYGIVEIHDAGTDAVVGTRPCTDAACRQRGEDNRRRAEQQRQAEEAALEAHQAVCTGTCHPPF